MTRPDQDEKARENRLRRAAERQGLRLKKSRRRDPRALDYRTYHLVNKATNDDDDDDDEGSPGMSLDEIEAHLTGKKAAGTRAEALEKLLAAVQTLGEFWEARVTGDELDNVDLMDVVLNAAEHAADGGRQPVCGNARVVSGHEVNDRSEGGNYVLYGDRLYRTSSAVCGRVAGHEGLHRGDNSRWSNDTPDWG